MSHEITQTRGELYEKYKVSNPVAAGKFLGHEYYKWSGDNVWVHPLIAGCLGMTAGLVIFLITIVSLKTVSLSLGLTVGFSTLGGGLVAPIPIVVAIYSCKRWSIRAEKLTPHQINAIMDGLAVDTTKGLMPL